MSYGNYLFNKNEELRLYKRNHGHTNVPSKDESSLGGWVRTQRKTYKLKMEGRYSTMTDERVEALNKLGFDWAPGRGHGGEESKINKNWSRYLEGECIKDLMPLFMLAFSPDICQRFLLNISTLAQIGVTRSTIVQEKTWAYKCQIYRWIYWKMGYDPKSKL